MVLKTGYIMSMFDAAKCSVGEIVSNTVQGASSQHPSYQIIFCIKKLIGKYVLGIALELS